MARSVRYMLVIRSLGHKRTCHTLLPGALSGRTDGRKGVGRADAERVAMQRPAPVPAQAFALVFTVGAAAGVMVVIAMVVYREYRWITLTSPATGRCQPHRRW